MLSLSTHVALVTGASGDIGSATVRAFLDAGARVAAADVAEVEIAKGRLPESARYDRVDVTQPDAVAAWIDAVESELGTPTLAVVNAAVVELASIVDTSPESWRRQMSVNLDGAFYTAQAFARRLIRARKPGRIVLVGSWAGHAPHRNMIAYSSAKAGLRMLGQCLALELAEHGILVNELAPGYVDAGLSARIFDEHPGMRERAAERVPIGQLIRADEVAREILLLCDPARRHLTGETVVLDGGLSLLRAGNMRTRRPSPEND